MKQVQYGTIITRDALIKYIVYISFINFWIASCIYMFLSIFLKPMVCTYGLFILIYLSILWLVLQHKQTKKYMIFDEEGMHIYTYPLMLYAAIIKRKYPMVTSYNYQETICSLAYHKRHSHYCLIIHVKDAQKEDILDLQIMALSKKNLHFILFMLSTKTRKFHDEDQLRLCLMQQQEAFDYYIQRLEERTYEQ